MKKTIIAILIVMILTSLGCSRGFSESADDSLFVEREILFDGDGDGVKSDLAVLSALGGSGGYGQHRLEVYSARGDLVFDSLKYAIDPTGISRLPAEAMVDSVYYIGAEDTDRDGCDEIVCRHYVWREIHSNHIGDAVLVFGMNGSVLEPTTAWFESCNDFSLSFDK